MKPGVLAAGVAIAAVASGGAWAQNGDAGRAAFREI
jgi:hypothetical protein